MNLNRLKNIFLLIVTIGITLTLVEITLRLADFPKQSLKPSIVYDPILLYKMPGNFPGVDHDGFRNPAIPEQVDLVSLGDSHTYGFNASIEENWPSQLASMTGLSVYNLGVGGYGPLQYFYLFDRALDLKPRYVIVGLLLSNDIKSICDLYLTSSYWKSRSFKEGLDLSYCNQTSVAKGKGEKRRTREQEDEPGQSKLLTLLQIGLRWVRGSIPINTDDTIVVDIAGSKTMFETRKVKNHNDYMDISIPEIQQSLEVTSAIFSKMAIRAHEHNAQLVVLAIPSKEYVFSALLRKNGRPVPEVMARTAEKERLLGIRIMDQLKTKNIPCIDAKLAVLSSSEKNSNVYPQDSDGHPLALGYKAYAQALYDGFLRAQLSNTTPR